MPSTPISVRAIKPIFINEPCPVANSMGRYYRQELDAESAQVVHDHLPSCRGCRAMLADAVMSSVALTKLQLQTDYPRLNQLMQASGLSIAVLKTVAAISKVHGFDTAFKCFWWHMDKVHAQQQEENN